MDNNPDHNSEESGDGVALELHLKISSAHKDVCRNRFVENTVSAEWKGKYLLHAIQWNDSFHDELGSGCDKWPYAFVGHESQPVIAAMWDTTSSHASGSKLVAVWTVSLVGDEYGLYLLDGWEDDVAEFIECDGMIGGVQNDSFCLSCDGTVVENLHCPALGSGLGPKKAQLGE